MTLTNSFRHPRLLLAVEIVLWLALLAQLAWVALPVLGLARGTPQEAAVVLADAAPLAGHDPFASSDATPATADVVGLKLFGVRLSSQGNAAILGAGSGTQRAHRVGDEIAAGVTLESVASDHVMLRQGGQPRRLDLPSSLPPGPTATPAPAATAAPAVAATPAAAAPPAESRVDVDPGRLIAEAGLRMVTDAGRGAGYTLLPRGNDALMRAAGLQPGDVLVSVNGQALDAERLAELAIQLKTNPRAEIAYRRDGQLRTVTLGSGKP